MAEGAAGCGAVPWHGLRCCVLQLCKVLKADGYDVVATCRKTSPELDALDVKVVPGNPMSDCQALALAGLHLLLRAMSTVDTSYAIELEAQCCNSLAVPVCVD